MLTVYTTLKQSDLHALSAFEMLAHTMGFTPLKALRRLDQWTLTSRRALDLETLARSYAVFNTNKQWAYTEIPPLHVGAQQMGLRVTTTSVMVDTQQVLATLNRHLDHGIESVTYRMIWDVVVDASCDVQTVLDRVVVASKQGGLLVHPLLESWSWTLI